MDIDKENGENQEACVGNMEATSKESNWSARWKDSPMYPVRWEFVKAMKEVALVPRTPQDNAATFPVIS